METISLAFYPNPVADHLAILTAEANLGKWSAKYPQLSGMDEWVRLTTAVLLTNQVLLDQLRPDESLGEAAERIILGVVPHLLAHRIVSVQPALGAYCDYHFARHKIIHGDDFTGHTVSYGVRQFRALSRMLKEVPPSGPETEAAVIRGITSEINCEVLNDLFRNAGTVGNFKPEHAVVREALYDAICALISQVSTHAPGRDIWIACGRPVGEEYPEVVNDLREKFDVHVVNEWYPNYVVVGARSSNVDAGYAFCPYIFVARTPVAPNPDFCGTPRLITRRAKYLLNSKYYASLMLP